MLSFSRKVRYAVAVKALRCVPTAVATLRALDFERIAAHDNRFPDGFTVPPGAPMALALQKSGDLAAIVVGRDGVPYISWQQQGAPWHSFERIAAPDSRFSDGFSGPPGALISEGSLVVTVVGRDGVPYIAW